MFVGNNTTKLFKKVYMKNILTHDDFKWFTYGRIDPCGVIAARITTAILALM